MPSHIKSCPKPSSRKKGHAKMGLVMLFLIVIAVLGAVDRTYIAQTQKDFGDFFKQVSSTADQFELSALNFRFQ